MAWFDAAPDIADEALMSMLKTYVDGQPFLSVPLTEWMLFLPPMDLRWQYVVNVGNDCFGMAIVLFYVLQNRRNNIPADARSSIASSLTLLQYGVRAILHSVNRTSLDLADQGVAASRGTRTVPSYSKPNPSAPEIIFRYLTPQGDYTMDFRSVLSKRKLGVSNVIGNPSNQNSDVRTTDEIREVIVIHDTDSEDEADVVPKKKKSKTAVASSTGRTSGKAVGSVWLRRSTRCRPTLALPEKEGRKDFSGNREVGELFLRWPSLKAEHEFVSSLRDFLAMHSTVRVRLLILIHILTSFLGIEKKIGRAHV